MPQGPIKNLLLKRMVKTAQSRPSLRQRQQKQKQQQAQTAQQKPNAKSQQLQKILQRLGRR